MKIANPFPSQIKTITILSPAGLPDADDLKTGIDLIRSWGIQVKTGANVLTAGEEGFSAADTQKRAADFNAALEDSATDLILCSRGGYGSARILPFVNWELFRSRNLPVLGYSDITALHLAMLSKQAGIPVTAVMAASFPRSLSDDFTFRTLAATLKRMTDRNAECSTVNLTPFSGGGHTIRGRVIAANLSLLASLCGTPYLPDFRGSILLLEDVGEKTRILDRHLVQLRLSGIAGQPSAIVFGDFTDCGESPEEIRVLLSRFASEIHVPVYTGLPFGHTLPTASFRNGIDGFIDCTNQFCF